VVCPATETRRHDRDVGAGKGDIELLLDDPRRFVVSEPNECLGT
jgi:hypothetical protein